MKAIITKNRVSNATQPKNKETVNELQLVTVHKGEIVELATARFYMGRSSSSSVVYCCLWVNAKHAKTGEYISVSGKGNAGGYGYHKESAALQGALTDAGVELYGTPYKAGTKKTESHWNNTKGITEETKIDYKRKAYIGGCGSTAMTDALLDIGAALGYKKCKVL